EGVGPRRFVDLFSLTLGSGRTIRRKQKGADGARYEWRRGAGSLPRLPLDPLSYLDRENSDVSYHSQDDQAGNQTPTSEDDDGPEQAERPPADYSDAT
ncbi:MAG: hypothetical protein AB1Z98_36935, partial [Nannocystaceae bacterium]